MRDKERARLEPLGATFNKLWSATLASHLADGLFKTAVPLLAATLTRDPVIIAALAAVVMLPWLLFAIPIGSMVDRVDRRQAMAIANSIRFAASAALTITIVTHVVNIPVLYVIAFIIGAADVLYDTTAQALLPQMLKPELLERGNSRLQIGATMVGEMVGSPLSGILYVAAIGLPFISGTLGVLLAAILVALIPGSYKRIMNLTDDGHATAKTSLMADMKFGIRYLYEDKNLLKLVLFTTSVGFWFSATGSTMVLFMLHDLNVPMSLFGFVLLSGAVGNIIGGFVAPRLSGKFGRMNTMAVAIFTSGFVMTIGGFSPNVWVWIALAIVGGIAMAQWNILLMSTYHQIIPNELFGRIHGTRRTLVWGLMPIGSLVGGLLAKIDLRAPMIIGGGLATLIALFGIPFVRSLSKLVETETVEQLVD